MPKKLSGYKINRITHDIIMGNLSDIQIMKKHGVSSSPVYRIKAGLLSKRIKVAPICGFEKRTPYYEDIHQPDGSILTGEDQMLSSPYYNPKELTGWERVELYRILLTKK